jgi:hypothetical protein
MVLAPAQTATAFPVADWEGADRAGVFTARALENSEGHGGATPPIRRAAMRWGTSALPQSAKFPKPDFPKFRNFTEPNHDRL